MNESITVNATTFTWVECLSDFAGNSSQAGFWADKWMDESGNIAITCGGGWLYYLPSVKAALDAVPSSLPVAAYCDAHEAVLSGFDYPDAFTGKDADTLLRLIESAEKSGHFAKVFAWVDSRLFTVAT